MDAGGQGTGPLPRLQVGDALFRPPTLSWKLLLHSVDLELCHSSFQVEIFWETCNVARLRWYFIDMAKIISLAITTQTFIPKPVEIEAPQGKRIFLKFFSSPPKKLSNPHMYTYLWGRTETFLLKWKNWSLKQIPVVNNFQLNSLGFIEKVLTCSFLVIKLYLLCPYTFIHILQSCIQHTDPVLEMHTLFPFPNNHILTNWK